MAYAIIIFILQMKKLSARRLSDLPELKSS